MNKAEQPREFKFEEETQLVGQFKVSSHISAGKGLGDVVSDFTHATGLDKVADKYSEVTGNDCGCDHRQAKLNRWFPDIW